jgi:predicted HTH domain antitoxin
LSEEGYKITVSLSEKGLVSLDKLKLQSGFGSRGRTIEEAILSVSELVELSKQLFFKYTTDLQKQGITTEETKVAIIGWFFVALTKLSRFSTST